MTLATICLGFPTGNACAGDKTAELQRMVLRVASNLELREASLRSSRSEADARYQALANAVDAWNQSGKTDADADTMLAWLSRALRASQLGARRSMPATPAFSEKPEVIAMPAPANSERAAPVERRSIVKTVTPEIPSEPAVKSPRIARSAPATRPRKAPRASKQAAAPATRREAPPAPEPTAQADWSAHPAAAELDWSDPFSQDEPAPGHLAGSGQATQAQQVSRLENVTIDLKQLGSQITGYNSRLQDIEGVVVGSQNLTAFRLAALLRDMDDLQEKRGFLRLYLDGFSSQEALDNPALESPYALIQMMQSAIENRSAQLRGTRTSQSNAERAILGSLNKKLAGLRDAVDRE